MLTKQDIVELRERDYRRALERVQAAQDALDEAQAALDLAESQAELFGGMLDDAREEARNAI